MTKHFYTALVSMFIILTCSLQAQEKRYVKENGTGDGSSWATASNDIQTMINELAAKEGGGEVWVAAGMYVPAHKAADTDKSDEATTDSDKAFVLKRDVKLYGGFAGNEASLDERDFEANETILHGKLNDADRVYHILIVAGDIGDAWIDGFTILEGGIGDNENKLADAIVVNEKDVDRNNGGGIYIVDASPVLSNLVVVGNKATRKGGGIYLEESASLITNLTVDSNHSGEAGGGICNLNSSSVLMNSVITNNSCELAGGGIDCQRTSNCITYNVIFSGNSAWNGGGISNFGYDYSTYEPVPNKNIYINVVVVNNESSMEGGGIADWFAESTYINVTISGNLITTYQFGGGVGAFQSNSTFRNCLIWGNTDNEYYNEVEGDECTFTYEYSLVKGINPEGEGNMDGTNEDNDPKFVNLSKGDCSLANNSPCLNKGSLKYYASDALPNISYIETDVIGAPRFANGTIDLGAYQNHSGNADIVSISVDDVVATLKSGSETDYEITIDFKENVIIDVKTVHDKATVSGDTGEKALVPGRNNFSFKVKSENEKTEKTYNLEVTAVGQASNDVSLASVTVDGVAATLKSGSETVYEIAIGNTDKITIAAVPGDANATISGDTGEKTVSEGANTFSIKVTAEDGVTAKDYQLEVSVESVGILETGKSSFSFYPNPVEHTLYIKSESQIQQLFIYDIQGKMVKKITNPENSINLEELNAGIYLIKAISATEQVMYKIVKK